MMLPEDWHMEMLDREIEAQHYFQPIFEGLRKAPDGSLISALFNIRYAAANRDGRMSECSEKLDLERPRAGAHMAFGSGTHHCLGAPLARRELTWGFTAVCDRFEDMGFAEAKNDLAIRPHFLLRGMAALHIEFEPKKG